MDKPTFPKWSVMIPAYGKGQYLEQTLRSVLAQAPGPEQMQIAVVENPSGNDGIRQVVERIADSRVEYCINDINLGMVGNWNRCIELARGELIHLLHDDDWVLPGFYEEISHLSFRYPHFALYAARCAVSRDGRIGKEVSPRIREMEVGQGKPKDVFSCNQLSCPGVVVRHSFYKNHGDFLRMFVQVPDWEMWVRAMIMQGGVISPKVLAVYRVHLENTSMDLARKAMNLEDLIKLRDFLTDRYPGELHGDGITKLAVRQAEDQMIYFRKRGDIGAYTMSREFWEKHAPLFRRLVFFGRKMRAMYAPREIY